MNDHEIVELLIANLRKTSKFGYLRTVIEKAGGQANRSWDLFRRDFQSGSVGLPAKKLRPLLEDFYADQIIGCERFVQAYRPDKKDRKELLQKVHAATPEKSVASKKYPYLLADDQLGSIPTHPTLTGKRILADGSIALTFLSGRYIDERLKFKRDDVTPAIQNAVQTAYQDFDEFIVIRKIFKQCVDAVVVAHDGSVVQLRLDVPSTNNVEFGEICATDLGHQFHALVHGQGGSSLLGTPVNFFPAIDGLYSDRKAGRVVELGFETPTNSVKTERMRDRSSDLRIELYHKAGKGAVPHITPFKISVRFGSKTGGETIPELSLPGNFRELVKPKAQLHIALVEGCINEDAFSETMATLLKYC
ncbi:hypothetical protein [Paraburkholderia tropica]|uniref:hypothetical protein n=1 Tax=Paraburkholderia tropica TaxID=92647 RepID=UPI002AB06C8C|nr:hypothetical protein [Paraburkholderia tropica]